jgi:lipopolysaccharide export system protein LptC
MAEPYASAVPRRVRFDPTRARGADAYDHAARHSRRVALFKFGLPAAAAVSIVGFFLTMRFADVTGTPQIAATGLDIPSKTVIMSAPHVSGFDSSQHPYLLTAIRGVQDLVNPSVVNLDRIDARFATDEVNTAVLKARAGVLDSGRNRLALTEGITIETTDGYRATMADADIDITGGNLASQKPVEVHSADGNWLKANGVIVENKGAKVTFINGVTVNYVPADGDWPGTSAGAEASSDAVARPAEKIAP